ncbi:shematrin-like protein 2 [Heteronotia binoei]|uniref:shematrin-like protein 2 n=1 Tax=Heteronotia binoei TaxID=13085 RepID=UPI002930119B|nr:shematrin-like protein 2 [Heteronotia binoei]
MAYCGSVCGVPSYASSPMIGLGSAGLSSGLGYGCVGSGYRGISYGGIGYGGLGCGYGGLGYGSGIGYGSGTWSSGGATSGELGTLSGIIPQPINQIPPAEVVIQPPASVVTIPGPILSATGEPVAVGGNTPCAVSGSGMGGGLYGGLGGGLYGGLGGGFSGALGYGLKRGGYLGRRRDDSLQGSKTSGSFSQGRTMGPAKAITMSKVISMASKAKTSVHLHPKMPGYWGPQFAVPSVASTRRVGFGSAGLGWGDLGLGCHGYDFGHGYDLGWAHGPAIAETSGSLGTLEGVNPSCINQIPPAEVTVQPPATVLTLPGPILSATGEPVAVGGNTPCAISGTGVAGLGFYRGHGGLYGGLGWGSRFSLKQGGFLGSNSLQGHHASIC